MNSQDLEQPSVQEAQPTPEAKKTENTEARDLTRTAFEKITSLEIFQTQKERLFAYAGEKTNEAIARSAAKMAEFVTSTNLSSAGQEKAAASSQVQAKLEANTTRFQAALQSFKDRVTEATTKYAKETIAAPTAEKKEAPTSPEAKAERKQKIMEGAQEKRAGLLKRTLSAAVDLVPFVGGTKMAYEAYEGVTSVGEEMTGKGRLLHAAMGIASLALDATGIGEAGKALGLAGKSVGIISQLAEKLAAKGLTKMADIVAKLALLMVKNPTAVLKCEELAEKQIANGIKSVGKYRKGERPVKEARPDPSQTDFAQAA